MERSRSKRSYYYDQDSDSQTPPPPPRTKGRYHHSSHYSGGGGGGGHHRRGGERRVPPPPPAPASSSSSKFQDGPPPSVAVTTSFRILCPDARTGGVIGKSGSIIKNFRQDTGAWISVHPLVPGDNERIIETSDNRRREPDGRPPQYSPAQEALILIHERILEAGFELDGEDDDEYGGGGGGWGGGGMDRDRDRGRATTRLVVPRVHVGCLMGKGGKIIEQMRIETKTHIRILPRDHNTPRCVSMSEEIVQVVGENNAVKKAIAVISSRLKESLHRDRGPFRGRVHSPEQNFSPDDEFSLKFPYRSEEPDFGQRSSTGLSRGRSRSFTSRSSSYPSEFDVNNTSNETQSFPFNELVFRILCPNNKVENIMGVSAGILDLLRGDVGVDVHLTDPVPGSDERIIIITSEEGPNDELFPAQEALLHIQSHIVDLGPDNDNIITTRLVIPANEIGFLEGRDGIICELKRFSNANVQILPREDLPLCAVGTDEVVQVLQIVGEIRAAREALVQITAKLRSCLFRDYSTPKDLLSVISTPGHSGSFVGPESGSPVCEVNQGSDSPSGTHQDMQTDTTWKPEDAQGCDGGSVDLEVGQVREDEPVTVQSRSSAPPAAQKTLEVVIPEQAVASLLMRSGTKLAQISEMSGAKVSLIEDRAEQTEKIVLICGNPEQAERAQSLLQGFILSIL